LSQDDIEKQKKDLADIYEMLYGDDDQRMPDKELVFSRK